MVKCRAQGCAVAGGARWRAVRGGGRCAVAERDAVAERGGCAVAERRWGGLLDFLVAGGVGVVAFGGLGAWFARFSRVAFHAWNDAGQLRGVRRVLAAARGAGGARG